MIQLQQPTAGEKKHQEFRNGFFRFQPDGSEVEFHSLHQQQHLGAGH